MYFALMGKLSARRQNLTEDKDKGFTLIELLVVVIIIGILAAIAIPVYLGVQNNAKDSGVKSDLTNLKTAVISLQTTTGAFPETVDMSAGIPTAANSPKWVDAGATKGTDTNVLKYTKTTAGFCVEGNRTGGDSFKATETSGVVKGTC
jgi:prepilin-type N-terminal cleavage/methylation domain-containing protein